MLVDQQHDGFVLGDLDDDWTILAQFTETDGEPTTPVLAGLIAIDLSPTRAAGAAMGVVGVFSYLGAAVQNWISGSLIEESRVLADGRATYDFGNVFLFWIGAAVLSLLLTLVLVALPRVRRQGR